MTHYDTIVEENATEVADVARQYTDEGCPKAAAIKKAVTEVCPDLHAVHMHDLFGAFDAYRGKVARFDNESEVSEWPAIDRDALLSTINEWTWNGPNPAESAALATAEALAIADIKSRATDLLADVDDDGAASLSLFEFSEKVRTADVVHGAEGVVGVAHITEGTGATMWLYEFKDGVPRQVAMSGIESDFTSHVRDDVEKAVAEHTPIHAEA